METPKPRNVDGSGVDIAYQVPGDGPETLAVEILGEDGGAPGEWQLLAVS